VGDCGLVMEKYFCNEFKFQYLYPGTWLQRVDVQDQHRFVAPRCKAENLALYAIDRVADLIWTSKSHWLG
jgi:hypothetical protein